MKKYFLIVYNYFKENLISICLIFALMFQEILVRRFCFLDFSKTALLFNFFAYSILFLLLSFFSKKYKFVISLFILIIYSIYSFIQIMHYSFFKSFFSFKKISVLNELSSVLNEALSKLKFEYILFLLPILVLIVVYLIVKDKIPDNSLNKKRIILPIVIICLILSVRYFVSSSYISSSTMVTEDVTSDSFLYTNISSNLKFYNRFGSFEYIIKDIERTNSKVSSLTNEEIKTISTFISNNKNDRSDFEGIYKDKNLILILCESLSPGAIDEQLTPTLYKLTQEGTYFTNFYAPLYPSNTCDAEFISQTGQIPSIDYGTTSKDFAENYYPYSLANLFKEAGYSANSYHSHIKEFYNREKFHESLGFEYLYDKNDLGLYLEGVEYLDWIDDSELFKATIDNTDISEPFYDFIITASGHLPYYVERTELLENYAKVLSIYPGILEQEAFYYAAQMKLDQGLETLLNLLDEKGILDDTIIVIFGDHYPYGLGDETLAELNSDYECDYEIYKTPLIIYDAESCGTLNNKLASTFDIYPTITSLFGLDDLKAYTVGEDLFVEDENRFVLFQDHSVLSKDFYYDASTSSISGSDSRGILELAKQHYKYSQEILASDYYALVK